MKPVARLASAVLLTLLALLGAVSSAHAFELIGLEWPDSRASYFINPNFPALAGSAAEQVEVLRCAADSWRNQSAADFRFDYAGQTASTSASIDGQSIVFFSPENDNEALAVTLISGFGNQFTEFDMIFFGSTDGDPNVWQNFGEPEVGNLDIRGTAVHEFGHALGLDHSMVGASSMFFTIQNRGLTLRTLEQDDRDGVVSIYGQRSGAELAPIINSFGPFVGSVFGGDVMTFVGTNFSWPSNTVIEIGANSVTGAGIVEESCARMVVPQTPPGSPGLVDIVVRNQIGTTVIEDAFEYRVDPVLTSIEPNRGSTEGGLEIRVHGENFTAAGSIFIAGSLLVAPRLISSTVFEGILPASNFTGPVNVLYVVGSENASILGGFTYHGTSLRIFDTDIQVDSTVPTLHFVDLSLSNNEILESLDIELSYDPSVLDVTGISTVGTVAENATTQDAVVDDQAGTLTIQIDTSGGSPISVGSDQTLVRIVARHAVGALPGQETAIAFAPDNLVPTTVAEGAPQCALGFDGSVTLTFPPQFVRSDPNDDGLLTIADPLGLLFHLFAAGFDLACPDAADFNDSGTLDSTDAILSLQFQFADGAPPAIPYPTQAEDPTPDSLGCAR